MADPVTQTAKTVANRATKSAAAPNPVTSPVNGAAGTVPTKGFAKNDPRNPENPKTADQLMSEAQESSVGSATESIAGKGTMAVMGWDFLMRPIGGVASWFGTRSSKENSLGTRIGNWVSNANKVLQDTNANNLERMGCDTSKLKATAQELAPIERQASGVAGLIGNRLGITTDKIAQHTPELNKLRNATSSISRMLTGTHGRHIADRLNEHVEAAHSHAPHAGTVSTSAEAYETALKGIQTETANAHNLLKGGAQGTNALSIDFTNQKKIIDDTMGGAKKSRIPFVGKTNGLITDATKATKGYGNLRFAQAPLKTLASSLKSIPATIANKTTHSTAFDATFALETAVSNISFAKDVSFHLNNLRHMCEVMEDTKEVSNFHVLFSKDVPKVVQHARKQVFAQFGPRAVIEAASDVLTGVGFIRSNFLMMMLPMGIRMAAGAASPKFNLLNDYGALAQAQASGEQLEGAHYAKIIAGASEAVALAGGNMNGLTVEVAKHYAKQQTPIDQVLREIESGQMNKIALGLQQERTTAGITAGTMDPEAQARAEAEQENYDAAIAREKNETPKAQIATTESVHASPTQHTMQQPATNAAIPTAIMPKTAQILSAPQQGIH